MFQSTNRKAVPGRFAVLALNCAILAVQVWIEFDYYREHVWQIFPEAGVAGFFDGIFSPWLPAALSLVLLAAIVFALFAWPRLGRAWWYAILPTVAVCTTLLVRLAVPIIPKLNIV